MMPRESSKLTFGSPLERLIITRGEELTALLDNVSYPYDPDRPSDTSAKWPDCFRRLSRNSAYRSLIRDHIVQLCVQAFRRARKQPRESWSNVQADCAFLSTIVHAARSYFLRTPLFFGDRLPAKRRESAIAATHTLRDLCRDYKNLLADPSEQEKFVDLLGLLEIIIEVPKQRKDKHLHARTWIGFASWKLRHDFRMELGEILPVLRHFVALIGADVSDRSIERYASALITPDDLSV